MSDTGSIGGHRRSRGRARDRHGKGTAEWVGTTQRGKWWARISVPGEGRKRFRLVREDGTDLVDKVRDRELAVRLAAVLSEAVRAQHFEAEATRLPARLTGKAFGVMWTSGELYENHGEVRRLGVKKSVQSDRYRLEAHVYPYVGHLPVADVTEQDIERCLAKASQAAERKLGRPWRQATKLQLYQLLKRLFDLAIKPGRLRHNSPVSVDLRPAKGRPKLYSFLYPGEFVKLVACTKVPLARRVYYVLAVYTGLRKGSLSALTWASADLVHGTLTSLESKTGLPQIFEISADLVLLLTRWYERRGRPSLSAPIVPDLECRPGREAETLRADLEAAGVDRSILFSKAQNVEALRFHDMRSTMVTWARRAGKGHGWISDRTGHMTEEMMRRYDRVASLLEDLRYEPFPDLSEAIPELGEDGDNVSRVPVQRRG